MMKVSKICLKMIEDTRSASKLHNIICQMILFSRLHHKCSSVQLSDIIIYDLETYIMIISVFYDKDKE